MRDRGERDVLDRLEIKAARIVYMADYLDDSRDEVWVHFTARAFDYMVDDHSGRLLKGQPDCLSVTRTIWKFKRQRDQWRVDAIEHNASQALPRSFSETARD
jgi:predicted lipid-binding transport protein (Tim44 family)